MSTLSCSFQPLPYHIAERGVNITGATNATLSLTNVQSGKEGSSRVALRNGAGSTNSHTATLTSGTPPRWASYTRPSEITLFYGSDLSLSAVATNLPGCNFPISYLWYQNGTNVSGGYGVTNATNFAFTKANAARAGVYDVLVYNAAGTTNKSWTVHVVGEGTPIWWGNTTRAWSYLPGITNTTALAGGGNHNLLLREDTTVIAWGTNDFGQTNVPSGLTNVVAIAGGHTHSLALTVGGTVIAWGRNNSSQTNVPSTLTNAIAICAGGNQSLALKKDGTVMQWGQTFASVPTGLSNVISITSGTNFHLALLSNATVVAWGNNANGQTNVPTGLTNVVAIAAGGAHALALRKDGTVVAWGSNAAGQTNVPSTNIMAIAAGYAHSLALSNDRKVFAWGDNTYGQTNTPTLVDVKLIAAGGYQNLVSIFSRFLQYPVDVAKDLLLIYNTNSVDSSNVCVYYLQHRPMVGGANVLGVGCTPGEFISTNNFVTQLRTPLLNWLNANPTKRPGFLILFLDIPSRFTDSDFFSEINGSVSYALRRHTPGLPPFITHINMNGTNDCRAYIDKLEFIGTNNSPGKVILSASAGTYRNTNYVVDNVRHGRGNSDFDYSSLGHWVSDAVTGLLQSGVSPSAIQYLDGIETNQLSLLHVTNSVNVAGYISWGQHSSLGGEYARNGMIKWFGDSRWWIIQTIESYNGQRVTSQGNFIKWFSANGFGGINYSNTPIGAITHVEEPGSSVGRSSTYFGLWANGKTFAICAWNSQQAPFFQAVGDPLSKR